MDQPNTDVIQGTLDRLILKTDSLDITRRIERLAGQDRWAPEWSRARSSSLKAEA